ncbi:MAG TPA: carboxypeptidase-like regulatory domain-containing protein, partial [Dongiaceae bacterium]|nr:carboxypeptidase-like regulatory domain-containing protein [Dongiaceae bacterium]
MMDEHLRDNVELLLRGSRKAPSPEFAARMDSLLRPPPPADRRRRFLPITLVATAAAAAFALILWIARQDQTVAPLPAPSGSQDAGAQDAGVMSGTVTLRGLPPPRKLINVAGMGLHTGEAYPNGLTYDPVPVDGANRIQGCLVFVRKGLEGHSFTPPKEPKRVEFDRYLIKPRMMAIMVGQDLVIENRDREVHNAHTLPWHNKETNEGLETVGSSITRKFTQPEKGIKVKCDIHYPPTGSGGDWEVAWITVLSHPFYAVTDEHGRFSIKGIPAGKYTIEAWQEHCVSVLKGVEIKPDQPLVLDLTL